VLCLASGQSKEAVMRIPERAGHPTQEVPDSPSRWAGTGS